MRVLASLSSLVLFLLFSSLSFAANLDTAGALTFVSLVHRVSPYGTVNLYHYDVFSFDDKDFAKKDYPSGWIQAYLQTSYSYQYRPNLAFTIGHIYQRSNPSMDDFQNENRIFEQITYVQNFRRFKLSHRVRFEERFVENRKEDETHFRTRVRYQIGAKIPLKGLVIDPNEFYINTYNEFYFSTSGDKNAFYSDDWAYLGLGWQSKNLGAFEMGPLVQWSRVNTEHDTRTHYTLQAGWIFTI